MNRNLTSLFLIFPSAAFAQGPLQPSATVDPATGPIAPLNGSGNPQPVMKTLHQVEPRIPLSAATTPGDATAVFRITQPGSYYLTSNLAGVGGKIGILIASGDVSLDLMGFSITGGSVGISSSSNCVTIRNGTISGSSGIGVSLAGADTSSVVENVISQFNTGAGFSLSADSTLRNCIARQNGGVGITATQRCLIENCNSNYNTGHGIVTGASSTVTRSKVVGHTLSGITADGIISDCTVDSSATIGIKCTGGIVRNSKAVQSSGVGFEGGANVSFENCQASGSGLGGNHGFNLAGNSIRMSRCSTVNFDRGIFVSTVSGVTGLVISECTVKQSTVSGILLRKDESAGLGGHQIVGCTVDGVSAGAGVITDNDAIIRDCIIRNTTSDGVRLSNNCKALNNTFIKNGASSADGGIYFSANTNILISGNTFQSITGWGILGESSSSRIVVTGNTFYQPSAGNVSISGSALIGPIVTSSGFPTNTHPNANFGF